MAERLVVVGGGAGGPSAAAKAKRLKPDLDVHILEAGPHVSYAACPTPYFIADMIATPEELIVRTPEAFEKSGIHVHLNTAVEGLDFNQGVALDSKGEKWFFDQLVYATGASSTLPDIPGVNSGRIFTLKSLQDAIRIRSFIETRKPKSVIILGAGFIALEMCESFRFRRLDTTVLYRGNLPAKRMGDDLSKILLDEMNANGVRFVPGVEPEAIVEEADGLQVETNDGVFPADMVLVALGVRPNVELARNSGILLGETGAVRTDASQRTNRRNVFSAGDCTEVLNLVSRQPNFVPLGDVANKQGRVAGANIGGEASEFPGVVGSWCFKFFELEVAFTGLNEAEARRAGFHPVSGFVTTRSRAGAYPGASPIHIRLVADRPTGRLLGAQMVGKEGAVGRTNVVAACLHRSTPLEELSFMDLCYAPPFSPAWDPLHIAAQECLKQF